MRILAIHGQLGMESDWDGLKATLTGEGHNLEAVDLWSYLSAREIGLGEFGGMLNEGQDDDQVLLGYSMGGRLALHALLDRPEKWRAAVIISAHAGLSEQERMPRRELDDEWARKANELPWAEFLKQWNGQGVFTNGKDVMPDRGGLKSKKVEVSRSFKCWGLAEQDDLLEKLGSLEIPILWVVGGKDEKFCIEGERVVKSLKNCRMLKIEQSGHRVPWEAEAELVEAVSEWLGDLV